MSKKARHVGRSTHRLPDNPAERVFAEAWQEINESSPGMRDDRGTLDYLLAEDPNLPCGEVTDRDAEVAATVIQWLGSPVGQSWLTEALKEVERRSA